MESASAASFPLSATARSKARKSSPLATAKPLKALETMSVLPLPGRWKRTAIPCGLAPAARSGMSGRPVLSENRTVTLIEPPRRCGAFDSPVPDADGTNSPSQTTPLAWADRKPGCLPKIAFIASTICSGRLLGSSALATRPSSVVAAIAFKMSRLPNALVIRSLRSWLSRLDDRATHLPTDWRRSGRRNLDGGSRVASFPGCRCSWSRMPSPA